MTKSLYILIIVCLGLTACVSTYEPDEDIERNIVVDLSLTPGENPTALVHLTNSLLDPTDSFYYPDSAQINLAIHPDSIGRVSYAQVPGLYTTQSIPIEEGETYFLKIDVPTKGVETLTASTTIPIAEDLESVTVESSIINVVGDNVFGEIILTVVLPESTAPNTFFQLVPSLKNGEEAAQGNIVYDEFTGDDVKILSEDRGLLRFIHKNGIFIDNNRLESNTVGLQLNYIVNPLVIDNIDSISFTLRTLNEEFMVYHENTDKELRTSSLPLDDPQISANNIVNGFGLFGAFSSSTIVVPIN